MKFAQIVLTDQQAALSRVVIDMALADEERFVMTDEERADYERLAVFYGQVSESPEAFPPTGKNATRVRSIVRRMKGPAQPPRKPKRHARLEQRQQRQKFLRKNRRELAAQYNAAVAKVEADMREADEARAEIEARLEGQPKFTVKSTDGRTLLDGIPAEFILTDEGEPAFPRIILPGA